MRKESGKPVFLSITESLRNSILFGKVEPGSAIIEKDIAATFNTSRAPVREAFRILEGERLIVRNEPVGYKVRELNLYEFVEMNTLLKIIEREMLLRAIPRYTELDLCLMEKFIAKISNAVDIDEFITHLIRFNEIVHEPAGWEFSVHLVRQILFRNVPYFYPIANQFFKQKMELVSHKTFVSLCRQGKIQDAIDCWIIRYGESEAKVFSLQKQEFAAM